MLKPEVVKKIRLLQLHTKKRLSSNRLGDYRSKQRGYGLEFDQLRSYSLGDDVRYIDWKSSSRMNQLLVKQYFHETNKAVIIALDSSGSMQFGSGDTLKIERAREVATALAFAGMFSKAAVGLIIFSDSVEHFIPPKQGKAHIQLLIDLIWQFTPRSVTTSLDEPLKLLARLKRQDSMAFLLSDFIDTSSYEASLRYTARVYDLVGVRFLDEREKKFPFSGLIRCTDMETSLQGMYKFSGATTMHLEQRKREQDAFFASNRIDCFDASMDDNYIDSLITFFIQRSRRG